MVKRPAMTAGDVEGVLRRPGFTLVRQTGHRIWQRDGFIVPVPAHPGDLPSGTLRNIIKLTGMTTEDFLDLRQRERSICHDAAL